MNKILEYLVVFCGFVGLTGLLGFCVALSSCHIQHDRVFFIHHDQKYEMP
jgi:hypothetical protein